MKSAFDKHTRPAYEYQVNDKVWLSGKNLPLQIPTAKLAPRRYGPFVVAEKVGPSSYRLILPPSWSSVHPVFNEDLLRPVIGESTLVRPLPDIIEGAPEWEVDYIVDSRTRYRRTEYLVHWKGFGIEDRTWEPEKNLIHSPDILESFKASRMPSA
jgi:hypothetical protein